MTATALPSQPTVIPGPPGHPLLGSVPALQRDLLGTLMEGFHRHGDVVTYRIGARWQRLGSDLVAVYHPEGVRHVLTNPQVFGRRTAGFDALTEMLGEGLLTSDGDLWKRQRRTLQPLFTPRRVAGYTDLMTAEAERVVGEGQPGSVVDLHELMGRYALRVVGRALFGDEIDDVAPALLRLVPFGSDLSLARSMQIVRLPLGVPTPRNRRFRQVSADLYAIVDRILARRSDGDRDDMLSRLHAARDPETGQPLSRAEIRDQVLVFLLAGHETTAGALTFTLHLLGRHPEIQERVATGDSDLVRAALMEGMRLYPPAHSTERRATADTEIAGYRIRRGTPVLVSPWVTHRHPEYWPDPERFDPDRFLGDRDRDRPRYTYFPFGGGQRSCIGEHFALLEATVLLRTLLTRYRVEALDAQLRLTPLITLRPAAPVRAALYPR
ncbi:cytochrome P450 [Planosporangium flavigriseum]|uniref:Cytochrome P450 n=1 Tax=Planosporangium flavigriseum TaxID=373681 RepID=A0A8J3LMW1_9ACTN|nr:cytochrome P450 [Planosporangium flavigriseum]NJC63919.1 cytochrome P450 [Planosporangium flavigriseum]GIG74632.1 cytochrome P450 [Planosporangium flavigriseum]